MTMKFSDIPRFTKSPNYQVHIDWAYLEDQLDHWNNKDVYKMELQPDFQRAHVWDDARRTAYVEFILRGGASSKVVYWNCPGWRDTYEGPLQLVDGLQRITAVRMFLNNEVKAFGHYLKEFEGRLPSCCQFIFMVNDLSKRDEILRWYLELNSGGVVHTDEELDKVRAMLEKEKRGQ